MFTTETDFDWGFEYCSEVKLNNVKVRKGELIQLMKTIYERIAMGCNDISDLVRKV